MSRYRKVLIERKRKKKKRIIVAVILAIIALVFFYTISRVMAYDQVSLELTDEELGIEPFAESKPAQNINKESPEKAEFEEDIINIAFFGLDRRDKNEQSTRSDAIMVATADFKHKKLKITSLMRDQSVLINGQEDKLNHAYAYGGAPLAIKAINENFGLDIRDYVAVDFYMLEDIIDALGGVEIRVNEDELFHLNHQMEETARLQNTESIPVEGAGLHTLNGMQAVSYSRIRKVGNGDFERTERQQVVLKSMMEKAKAAGPLGLSRLWIAIAPHLETSLDSGEILEMAKTYLEKQKEFTWEQQRYPLDGTWESGSLPNGGWIMKVNREEQKESITNYLYEDIPPILNEID